MRDPAREEERDRGVLEVRGTDLCAAEEVAHVIECHDDHHEAAQHVDGRQPGSGVRARGRLDDDRPVPCAHRHHGVGIAAGGSCVEMTHDALSPSASLSSAASTGGAIAHSNDPPTQIVYRST